MNYLKKLCTATVSQPKLVMLPRRRRGRLTEQQEAAAKQLRELREAGGKRTDVDEVRRVRSSQDTGSVALTPLICRWMRLRASMKRLMSANLSRGRRATGRWPRISSKMMVGLWRAVCCRVYKDVVAEGIGYLNEEEDEEYDDGHDGKQGRAGRALGGRTMRAMFSQDFSVGGGASFKKQRLANKSGAQSMNLSNYLRKGHAGRAAFRPAIF